MNKPLPPRKKRPSRTAPPVLPDFKSLDQVHQAALRMLGSFRNLVEQLQDRGLDEPARKSAREILAYFDGPGRDHHAEEELKVFPVLLASGDAQLIAQVRQLQQDHGWLEEDWIELAPHVRSIADGYLGYDLGLLAAAVPVFEALYRDHIALEETQVYPAAKRQEQALPHGRQG